MIIIITKKKAMSVPRTRESRTRSYGILMDSRVRGNDMPHYHLITWVNFRIKVWHRMLTVAMFKNKALIPIAIVVFVDLLGFSIILPLFRIMRRRLRLRMR